MQSPILKFSLQSFEFALELYMQGDENRMKFCLIHLDNSIELILKEKLRQLKVSIYNQHGKTIDFTTALNALHQKGINIPERSDLEIIRDDRNFLQHKGAHITVDQTKFYLEIVFKFMERFMKDELGLTLKNEIPQRYYDVFVTKPTPQRTAKPKVTPKSKSAVQPKLDDMLDRVTSGLAKLAFTGEFRTIEDLLLKICLKNGYQIPPASLELHLDKLVNKKIINSYDAENYKIVKEYRNKLVHTDYMPLEREIRKINEIAEALATNLRKKIRELIEDEIKKNIVTIPKGAAQSPSNPSFDPMTLQIKVGQVVKWENHDMAGHTITSGKPSDTSTGGGFDSGLISPNKSFQQEFPYSGVYHYFCQVHPWITAKIVVTE